MRPGISLVPGKEGRFEERARCCGSKLQKQNEIVSGLSATVTYLPCIYKTDQVPSKRTAPDVRARTGCVVCPNRGLGGVVAVDEQARRMLRVVKEELDLVQSIR